MGTLHFTKYLPKGTFSLQTEHGYVLPLDCAIGGLHFLSGSGMDLRLSRLLHVLGRPLGLFAGGEGRVLESGTVFLSPWFFCWLVLSLLLNSSSSIFSIVSSGGLSASVTDWNSVALRLFSTSLIFEDYDRIQR